MAAAASEVTWTVRLLAELGVDNLQPIILHCDTQSAIYIAKNPVFHERTKHIEVDCHFTRDKVLEGLIQLSYLPTKHQLADILTKTLPSPQLQILCSKLGLSDSQIGPNLRGAITDITNESAKSDSPPHNTSAPPRIISALCQLRRMTRCNSVS